MAVSLLEYVSLSGVIGRTEAEVQDYVTSNQLPPDSLMELLRDKLVLKNEETFVAIDEFQDIFLLENRVIDLTPMSKRALSSIAASGTSGILQTDLAKALGVDNKTLFHHMKPLVKYDLITRHPVASKKAFTYLCTLSKFFIEDTSDVGGERTTNTLKMSSVVFKDSVLKILSTSKGKTFSTKQLYEQCCPEGTDAKDFRRCLLALEHDGQIEILSTRELGGTTRLVRLKSVSSGDNTNEDDEADQDDDAIQQFSAPLLVDFVPVERQVRDYILECGAKGATMNDIVRNFGLRKKFAFRLMERLVDKKCVLNTDVTRQAEFAGRERRYKFTIITDATGTQATGKVQEMNRDSINRVKRQQEILNLLNEKKIVEIGRGMADIIAKRLGESAHIVDVKTLKRTINLMKANEQLEVHTVGTMNYGDRLTTRMVITLPSVKNDSAEFKQLLASLDHKPADSSTDNKQEADFVDVNKYDFGFVFGVMERLRQCHLYLADLRFSDNNTIFNTASVFFKDMPLQLFHQLIGCNVKMSTEYHNIANNAPQTPIKDLPIAVHRQVNVRLKEHKKVIHSLINIMLDLGHIKEHQEMGIVESTRVPFVIDFCDTVTLTDPFENDGDKEYKFNGASDVERYWNGFAAMARVPEELDIEKPEKYDIRNWSNRPVSTAMTRAVEREAERIADTSEDNQVFSDAVSRLSKKLLLDERVVSCYLEYYVSLIQPETEDQEDQETSDTYAAKETKKRRRRRQDGFTAEESLQLKLIMAMIEIEQIRFPDGPMWTTLQSSFFPNRSADDLRRKYGNILKSISEIAAFDAVKSSLVRIKQLCDMGLVGGKPEGDINAMYLWYNDQYIRLNDTEAAIISRQPKSLHEAKSLQWVTLAVDTAKSQKAMLSDHVKLPDNVNAIRKSLLYSNEPINNASEELLQSLRGFASVSNDTLKLSSAAREWLLKDYTAIPEVLQTGEPLTPSNTHDASLYDIYRLYGRGSLRLIPGHNDDAINFTVTVHKPSSDDAQREAEKSYLWFDQTGRFDEGVFYKSLLYVLDIIGAGTDDKWAIKSPVLSGEEIAYLLEYLRSHDYIRLYDNRLLPIL